MDSKDSSQYSEKFDRLERWVEFDKVKIRNKHRFLKPHSRKTTNNSLIKIIQALVPREPDISQQTVTF